MGGLLQRPFAKLTEPEKTLEMLDMDLYFAEEAIVERRDTEAALHSIRYATEKAARLRKELAELAEKVERMEDERNTA